jgi:hypothetical protein
MAETPAEQASFTSKDLPPGYVPLLGADGHQYLVPTYLVDIRKMEIDRDAHITAHNANTPWVKVSFISLALRGIHKESTHAVAIRLLWQGAPFSGSDVQAAAVNILLRSPRRCRPNHMSILLKELYQFLPTQ